MANAIILRRRKLGRGSTNGIAAVSTAGIKAVRNWVANDWPVRHTESGVMTIFRWGCTSNIPPQPANIEIVNSAASIHWCSDKKQGRLDMQEAGVPVPYTLTASAFSIKLNYHEWMDIHKFVLRPSAHAQGRNLYHGGVNDINAALSSNPSLINGYVSELIDKVAEYRVMVVQNRVAWVAKKTPGNPDDVAWNVAAGGKFDNVRWGEWPLPVIVSAIQAAKVSRTDFCGVDVMVDAAGRPYVLEVNSAPSQTSPYRQQCLAKAFDYIVENGKAPFPTPETVGGWRDVIHPAVWSREE